MTVSSTDPAARLSPDDRLASQLRHLLLPQRFPYRRDVEVAGKAGMASESCSFYDVFWLSNGLLACCAARVPVAGLTGALRATVLQKMVRAALTIGLPPIEALVLVNRRYRAEFASDAPDLVLATLDLRSARLLHAGRGLYAVRVGTEPPEHSRAVAASEAVWLAAGVAWLDAPADGTAEAGIEEMVARLAAGLPDDGALIGLLPRDMAPRGGDEFSISNDPAAIAGLVERVEVALARAGASEAAAAAVALALDELLTNTISYGYADGERHEIFVVIETASGVVDVTVRDDGQAFDPLSVSPPDLSGGIEDRQVGGLGIHFVRTLMDELRYEREKGWNILRLRKRFDPAGAVDAGEP